MKRFTDEAERSELRIEVSRRVSCADSTAMHGRADTWTEMLHQVKKVADELAMRGGKARRAFVLDFAWTHVHGTTARSSGTGAGTMMCKS